MLRKSVIRPLRIWVCVLVFSSLDPTTDLNVSDFTLDRRVFCTHDYKTAKCPQRISYRLLFAVLWWADARAPPDGQERQSGEMWTVPCWHIRLI
jgi:hypothetical protein